MNKSTHKEMGTNYNRINKIEPYLKNFNFKNTNYPLEKEDCEIFERNNESVSLNILKPDNERKSNNTEREIKIYLLLLENKHYTYVTKPHILLKYLKN